MKNLKIWLSAFRLRTLPLSVSGIIVASFLAYYNGVFDPFTGFLAICTVLSLQILSNLANDYGDGIKGTDNENRIGPERAIQSGLISKQAMQHAIKINILIAIFFVIYLIFRAFRMEYLWYSLLFFILGGLTIAASIKYTVGKKAYGYRALGDLMVFICFGLLSVIGCYFLYAKQIDHVTILPACVIGMLSTAVLNLNNMRDIESDKKSNKITVAVKLGLTNAKRYHVFLVGGAIILATIFGLLYYTAAFNLIYFLVFIPLLKHLIFVIKNKEPKQLDSQLKILALSTFFLAILLGIGHIYNAI